MNQDTGTITEVKEKDRLDHDEEGSYALEGGDDTDGLDEIFKSPGKIIDIGGEDSG